MRSECDKGLSQRNELHMFLMETFFPAAPEMASKMSLSDDHVSTFSDDPVLVLSDDDGEEEEEEEVSSDGDEDQQQLEYDMWEGQFDLSVDGRCATKSSGRWTSRRKVELKQRVSQPSDLPKNFSFILDELMSSTRSSSTKGIMRQISLPLMPRNSFRSGKNFNPNYWQLGDVRASGHLCEDVLELQEQVGSLAESQANTDDRYSKVKQENNQLTQRIHMLEEQIREVEVRAEEKLQDEQRRNRESHQRLEREKQLEIENYSIKLQATEREVELTKVENQQLRVHVEKLRSENLELDDRLNDTQYALSVAEEKLVRTQEVSKREAERMEEEAHCSAQLIQEHSKEIETLRELLLSSKARQSIFANSHSMDSAFSVSTDVGDLRTRVNELEGEVRVLKETNRGLTETKDELHAEMLNRGLEEGKILLSTVDATPSMSLSIADELGGMSDFQVKKALKEQQEVNAQLRGYIDGILMNIMEKYPELLEVKQ